MQALLAIACTIARSNTNNNSDIISAQPRTPTTSPRIETVNAYTQCDIATQTTRNEHGENINDGENREPKEQPRHHKRNYISRPTHDVHLWIPSPTITEPAEATIIPFKRFRPTMSTKHRENIPKNHTRDTTNNSDCTINFSRRVNPQPKRRTNINNESLHMINENSQMKHHSPPEVINQQNGFDPTQIVHPSNNAHKTTPHCSSLSLNERELYPPRATQSALQPSYQNPTLRAAPLAIQDPYAQLQQPNQHIANNLHVNSYVTPYSQRVHRTPNASSATTHYNIPPRMQPTSFSSTTQYHDTDRFSINTSASQIPNIRQNIGYNHMPAQPQHTSNHNRQC